MDGVDRCPGCGTKLTLAQRHSGTCPACILQLGLLGGPEPGDPDPAGGHDERSPLPPTAAPETIGPYRIERVVAEGGMGVVYLARQQAPIRRRVAVKVIKRGMDTGKVIARFEAERQALALMEHPAIARVIDAGETPSGRPYFVMEYVEGRPINEYCSERRLPLRDRLELFITVCEGVQHAHQKGVIHRDLKPSNVLVSVAADQPSPKIIDFGIAKAIEHRLTERSLVTELGMLVGTPEYMSPEQADLTGFDVDTRTDVYALGVLLYELLTGVLPFDPEQMRKLSLEQVCRMVREQDPPRPSLRASSAELAGDLDWIVMKALDKERSRRYGSPAELAEDLRRHLRNEPVLAGPPSATYRFGKFVRRNKVLVASLAAVAVALAAGALLATAFAVRETAQRREAERARADLQKVVEFQAGMLADVEPARIGEGLLDDLRERVAEARRQEGADEDQVAQAVASFDRAVSGVNATDAALRILDVEILDRAARALDGELAEDPPIEAALRHSIARTYRAIGLLDRAEPQILRAVEIRRRELGSDDAEALASITECVELYSAMSRYDEAEPLATEAVEISRRVHGNRSPITARALNSLAIVHWYLGHYDRAEPLLREALAIRREALGEDDPETIFAKNNLAILFTNMERRDEAEDLYLDVLASCRRVFGEDHPKTLIGINNLAVLYQQQGRLEEAEKLLTELVDRQERLLGHEHPDALRSRYNLAGVLSAAGRLDEAERLFEDVLEAQTRTLGASHKDTLATMQSLGMTLANMGLDEQAETRLLAARDATARALGERHPDLIYILRHLSRVYQRLGRLDDAESAARDALRLSDEALGESHPLALSSKTRLGEVLAASGRRGEAETLLLEALSGQREAFGADDEATIETMRELIDLYVSEDDSAKARPIALEMLAALRGAAESTTATTRARDAYARALLTVDPPDLREPSTALRIALEVDEASGGENPDFLHTLALACHETGSTSQAVETLRRALSLLSERDLRRRRELESLLGDYEGDIPG